MVVEPPSLDFGFIAPGEPKTGLFTLKNPTTRPFTIMMIQPTCTCTTTSDMAGRVIAPGESIQFDATLAGASATGPRKSTIKVIIEGYSKPVEVDVRAEVVMELRAVPAAINVLPNTPVAGRVVIESVDRKPFRIISINNAAPVFIGFDPAKDAPRNSYLVRYDFSEYVAPALPAWCLVLTDRPGSPVLALKVRTEKSNIVPVVRMKEYNLNLGAIPLHGAKEFTLELVDWTDPVESVASLSAAFAVELVEQAKAGENTQVRCRVKPVHEALGLVQFQLALKSGGKTQNLWAYGVVQEAPSAPITLPIHGAADAANGGVPGAAK
jgi:hypothetical protein